MSYLSLIIQMSSIPNILDELLFSSFFSAHYRKYLPEKKVPGQICVLILILMFHLHMLMLQNSIIASSVISSLLSLQ